MSKFKVGDKIKYCPRKDTGVDSDFMKHYGCSGVIMGLGGSSPEATVLIKLNTLLLPFNPFTTDVRNIKLLVDQQLQFDFMYER